jgi:hypothetical protein
MSKKLRKLLVGISAAACATFTVSTAFASPISVSNFSFETLPPGGLTSGPCGAGCSWSEGGIPIPGWSTTGFFTGQFQPGPSAGNFTYFNSVPDGITVAYTNGGTISQTVGPTVALGVVYTLRVEQGLRKDGFLGADVVDLLVNGTPWLATGVAAPLGDWATYTATYIGLLADVGSSITIELTSSTAQGDWDNVRLDDNAGVVGVPEPLTLALFGAGLAGMAGMRRRKKAA